MVFNLNWKTDNLCIHNVCKCTVGVRAQLFNKYIFPHNYESIIYVINKIIGDYYKWKATLLLPAQIGWTAVQTYSGVPI